ncbi:MAG: hypothetical protein KJ600_00280 [Nanoarchaeota archaeon]|nr:hypothetical protein [Nanoarchaeota archaeon]
MRKILFIFLAVVVVLVFSQGVLAEGNLSVEKIPVMDVVIAELDKPAVYELVINNSGEQDSFEIYTLVGVRIEPKGSFVVSPGETRIEIQAFMGEEIRKEKNGFLYFEYQMKGKNFGIFKDKLLVRIVRLADVLEIGAEPLHPEDSKAEIIVKNLENIELENVTVEFDSAFFSATESVSLEPYGEARVEVELNKEELEKIIAGPYIISANVRLEDAEESFEGVIEFLEKEGTSVREFSEGFVVRKTVSEKTNEGNTVAKARIEVKKDIVSRLFTTTSLEPASVEREGLFVVYSWEKELKPGETLVVESKTNYTFPFVLVILVVLIGGFVWVYSMKAVSLSKKVSLVRTKGGEFALKVKLRVKARRNVDKVQIVDSVPRMTKLFDSFGKKPDKIDKLTRRLFWDVGSLTKGEVQIYSYIIYSKMNIVGRFELSPALVSFEKDGRRKGVLSNRAFFAAEKD